MFQGSHSWKHFKNLLSSRTFLKRNFGCIFFEPLNLLEFKFLVFSSTINILTEDFTVSITDFFLFVILLVQTFCSLRNLTL